MECFFTKGSQPELHEPLIGGNNESSVEKKQNSATTNFTCLCPIACRGVVNWRPGTENKWTHEVERESERSETGDPEPAQKFGGQNKVSLESSFAFLA